LRLPRRKAEAPGLDCSRGYKTNQADFVGFEARVQADFTEASVVLHAGRIVPTENSIQRFSTKCNIVTFSSPIWRGLTFIFFMSLISKPLPPDGIFGRDK
jgi:hypothetical protein